MFIKILDCQRKQKQKIESNHFVKNLLLFITSPAQRYAYGISMASGSRDRIAFIWFRLSIFFNVIIKMCQNVNLLYLFRYIFSFSNSPVTKCDETVCSNKIYNKHVDSYNIFLFFKRHKNIRITKFKTSKLSKICEIYSSDCVSYKKNGRKLNNLSLKYLRRQILNVCELIESKFHINMFVKFFPFDILWKWLCRNAKVTKRQSDFKL